MVTYPRYAATALEQLRVLRLINGYGPTENTTFTCCCSVNTLGDKSAVGADGCIAIANTIVYVLDENGDRAPLGVAGELYVGGDGLARGYWVQGLS